MVYKKYIVKNGKTYGPYTYHSKRIDGKVVSEYHGKKLKSLTKIRQLKNNTKIKDSKNIIIIVGVILFLTIILSGFFIIKKSLTGNVSLELETTYYENESLKGNFIVKLKQGELIPANSKVKFETESKIYEYLLSELIKDESINGNFYIEEKIISGNGEGYGVLGEAEIPKEVSFTLETLSESSKEKTDENKENSESPETTSEEEIINETEIKNETISETENQESPETTSESENEVTPGITSETTNEKETTSETNKETESSTETQTENQGETQTEESQEQTESGQTEEATQTILTGSVINEIKNENEIDGKTLKDFPYSYELSEGQTASLKKGSVESNGKKLDDSIVNVKIQENKVTVTTDYTETEQGFGEEYLGDISKEIKINIEELNIEAEKGKLKASIVYSNEELVSASTNLNIQGQKTSATNGTEILNKTIEKISLSKELTEKDKEFLLEKLGNSTLKTTKAEIINGRLLLKYELGKYWVEYTYGYKGSLESLENLMERDRAKWLKDLTIELSKNKTESEKLKELLGLSFNLTDIRLVNITIKDTTNTNTSKINETIFEINETEVPEAAQTINETETASKEETPETQESINISSSNETSESANASETETTPITGNVVANTKNSISKILKRIEGSLKI